MRIKRNRWKETQLNVAGPLNENEMLQLYALRGLMGSERIWNCFLQEDGFGDTDIARKVGLRRYIRNYDKDTVEEAAENMLDTLERRYSEEGPLRHLRENFEDLGRFLNVPNWEVLLFLSLNRMHRLAHEIYIMDFTSMYDFRMEFLCDATRISSEEAQDLSQRLTATMQPLRRLTREDKDFAGGELFPFFDTHICQKLCCGFHTIEDIVKGVITEVEDPHLSEDNFPYFEEDLSIMKGIVRSAIEGKHVGTNLLMHGPPGTGKTQLARIICKSLGIRLYEISAIKNGGETIAQNERLEYTFLAGRVLQERSVLLCDECEEFFNGGIAELIGMQRGKGALHALMETTPLPIIWICNETKTLKEANARRFSYVAKCPIPPIEVRRKIVREAMKNLVSPPMKKRLSKHGELSPAILEKTAKTLRDLLSLKDVEYPMKRDELAMKIMNGILELQKVPTVRSSKKKGYDACAGICGRYDPAFLNADADLEYLQKRLKRASQVNMCFKGPPGTGKTSWAHHLAKYLKRPLIERKASDLMDPYVGNTEKRIAGAFKVATQQKAILLIDEVDTFLQARGTGNRPWVTAMVNEMLTQMERFEGLFIASTNHFNGLDTAALRRFHLKIEFDYLRPEQVKQIFCNFCKKHKLGEPSEWELEKIGQLETVTPGDFSVIEKQIQFRPLDSRATAIEWLEREQEFKPENRGTRRNLGFAAC
jgi:SpoVK/Ycf46/Vps4 family AAA+-type ATPase